MTEQVGISFIFVLAVLSVHCFSYMFQVTPYLLEIQKITWGWSEQGQSQQLYIWGGVYLKLGV